MNCHHDENQDKHSHSPAKHMIHMILCCALPIIIILSLPFVTKINPGVAVALGVIAPFICPIMMGGMMFMMFRGSKNNNNQRNTIEEEENSQL